VLNHFVLVMSSAINRSSVGEREPLFELEMIQILSASAAKQKLRCGGFKPIREKNDSPILDDSLDFYIEHMYDHMYEFTFYACH
jgi:hypothetical protein